MKFRISAAVGEVESKKFSIKKEKMKIVIHELINGKMEKQEKEEEVSTIEISTVEDLMELTIEQGASVIFSGTDFISSYYQKKAELPELYIYNGYIE